MCAVFYYTYKWVMFLITIIQFKELLDWLISIGKGDYIVTYDTLDVDPDKDIAIREADKALNIGR